MTEIAQLRARKKIGRPSKFTPVISRRVLRSVERGTPLTHAAHGAGVSYPTFLAYKKSHPKFAEAVLRAVARGMDRRLKIIEEALSSKDESVRLRASCWYLEHVHPEHFARNRIEVTGADGSPLAAAVAIYLPKKDGNVPAVEVNPPKQIQDHECR